MIDIFIKSVTLGTAKEASNFKDGTMYKVI